MTLNFENIFNGVFYFIGDYIQLLMGLTLFFVLAIMVYEWFKIKP